VVVTSKACLPCQKMRPILDRVGGKWTITYVDFDDPDMKQLMEVYQITSVPYYVTFRGHEALEVADGLMSLEEVLGWLGRLEQKLPADPGSRFKRCTAQDTLTPADRVYLQLQISPGSCKMLGCLTHPGSWTMKKLKDVPDEKKPPGHWEVRSVQSAGGCPGGNCPGGGCPSGGATQKVWVADPDPAEFVPWPQGGSIFGRRR
jgi:thiol-disulfide isomerase/thioredoxin